MFTEMHPDLDLDTAYDVLRRGLQAKLDAGKGLVGAKRGLTRKAKQRVMHVDAPLYGFLSSSMLHRYGEPVEVDSLVHPRVEPEIACVMARDVQAPGAVTSLLAATEAVFAVIATLDSRDDACRFTVPDVVADNASTGLLLTGARAVDPVDVGDLGPLGRALRVDGEVEDAATGAAERGHAAASVAHQLGARGQQVEAGWLTYPGGLTEPVPLKPGQDVTQGSRGWDRSRSRAGDPACVSMRRGRAAVACRLGQRDPLTAQ